MRLILAALLSPLGLVPALVAFMIALVAGAGAIGTGHGMAAGVTSGLLLAGFGVMFALLGSLVVLLPGALLLRMLGVASTWTIAALGLAAGLVVGLLERGWTALALFGLSGLGVGVAFGLIAGPSLARRPRRP
jgi:hypothetical protein